jgi:hypothetical protein
LATTLGCEDPDGRYIPPEVLIEGTVRTEVGAPVSATVQASQRPASSERPCAPDLALVVGSASTLADGSYAIGARLATRPGRCLVVKATGDTGLVLDSVVFGESELLARADSVVLGDIFVTLHLIAS